MQGEQISELYEVKVSGTVPPGNRIFVAGTWSEVKAKPFRQDAFDIGFAIGEAGLDLACGPGTGVAAHAIDGYRSATESGTVDFFLPSSAHMIAVGESLGRKPDRIIQTNLDYVMRNVMQVGFSRGVIAVSGGDGTLEELLPALIDYNLPVGVVTGSGAASRAVVSLADAEFPDWHGLLITATSGRQVARKVIQAVLAQSHAVDASQPFNLDADLGTGLET